LPPDFSFCLTQGYIDWKKKGVYIIVRVNKEEFKN
jgi:hypothetical protein